MGATLFGSGCDPNGSDGPVTDGECVDDLTYFSQQVWAPVLSKQCIACHNPQGAAKKSKMVLLSPSVTGFMQTNFDTVREVATFEYDGESILTLKPTAGIPHGGGSVLSAGDSALEGLRGFVKRLDAPVTCKTDTSGDDFWSGLTVLGPEETLRRATLTLAGRLPSDAERAFVIAGGEDALASQLDALIDEPAFDDWLRQTYNDKLLTDRYLPGSEALDLLSSTDYPNRYWFDDDAYSAPASLKALGDDYANRGVAREALELIVWVVRQGKPFSEILTADYIVVNPLSAHSMGVADQLDFGENPDPLDLKVARVPGVPHAGILTMPMFLNRFPTTETNRNRHRSRMVQEFFLATDVMKLAERPIDPTAIEGHNPTMFNENCTVCHVVMDPIAGAFQNWTADGRYEASDGEWFEDMLPAGFGETKMPYAEHPAALQWLAKQLTADPRFDTAAAWTAWFGLTGQPAISPPGEGVDGADYEAQDAAYQAQQAVFAAAVAEYKAADRDFRVLVRALIMSPAFRVDNAPGGLEAGRVAELAKVGAARLLTPEALHQKLIAVTGLPWAESPTGYDYLLSTNRLRIFYGGIDSDTVTRRITDPNGLMAAVQDRMANEMACVVVTQDMAHEPVDRILLPYIELSFTPEDENGFEIPGAIHAIEETIRHLHQRVLGESLDPSDPELQHTYDLFYETWREGRDGVVAGTLPEALNYRCRATSDWMTGVAFSEAREIVYDRDFTARAWMAVMSYLLSDYRFLYE